MTIAAMVPVVREALGVSSSYDNVTIPAGIRRAIAFMLRTWQFPQALTLGNFPIAASAQQVALPAAGVGMIHAVRLKDGTAAPNTLYKRLRRTLVGELPHSDGPVFYWREGNLIKLDTALGAGDVGYSLDIWYNNVNIDTADPWITSDFEDITFTLSTMRLATELRKMEIAQTFQAAWQEQVPTLATYLNELEWNDIDIRMKPAVDPPSPPERYGS